MAREHKSHRSGATFARLCQSNIHAGKVQTGARDGQVPVHVEGCLATITRKSRQHRCKLGSLQMAEGQEVHSSQPKAEETQRRLTLFASAQRTVNTDLWDHGEQGGEEG